MGAIRTAGHAAALSVRADADPRRTQGVRRVWRALAGARSESLSCRDRFCVWHSVGDHRGSRRRPRAPGTEFLRPAGVVSLSIPKIAFLPVFLLLFGLGHASKIGIIAFSVFFPVFIASRHAVLSINPILLWAARNMGTPPRTIFFRVTIPAAAPQLFAGIRIGLAHAFVVLFTAELIGSKTGLANLISYGEDWVRFDLMFAGIVCFAVLGFLSDRILMAVRRRVLRGHLIGTEEQVTQ